MKKSRFAGPARARKGARLRAVPERLGLALSAQMHRPVRGRDWVGEMARQRKTHDPFCGFDSSPEVIRLVVMMCVRDPLSLRNVEGLLFARGIDICHETVRLWWNRFGPMFAGEIRRRRVEHIRAETIGVGISARST